METYKKFKPNLIPNSKVTSPIDLESIIGDSVSNYIVSYKKDGCRMEFVDGKILTRALKPVTSLWVQERFQKLADKCKEIGIILEGEFFSPELRFNEIVRYFKTEDVRSESSIKKLLKLEESGKLASEWPGRSVKFMSTYPESLKLYPFDLLTIGQEDIPYLSRMEWLFSAFYNDDGLLKDFAELVEFGPWFNIVKRPDMTLHTIITFKELEEEYEKALELGYEGLVIANKNRTYKFNRSTARDNHIFKMKEDKEVLEGNKFIAEFMGLKPQSDKDGRYFDTPDRLYKYDVDEWKITNTCTTDTMMYHSSWDWLMPVVKKIESIIFNEDNSFNVTIGSGNYCVIQDSHGEVYDSVEDYKESKLLTTYSAVVEFIKWYNSNNQTNDNARTNR